MSSELIDTLAQAIVLHGGATPEEAQEMASAMSAFVAARIVVMCREAGLGLQAADIAASIDEELRERATAISDGARQVAALAAMARGALTSGTPEAMRKTLEAIAGDGRRAARVIAGEDFSIAGPRVGAEGVCG